MPSMIPVGLGQSDCAHPGLPEPLSATIMSPKPRSRRPSGPSPEALPIMCRLALTAILVAALLGGADQGFFRAGLLLRHYTRQAAEERRSGPLCHPTRAEPRKSDAGGPRAGGYRGARADRASGAQRGGHDAGAASIDNEALSASIVLDAATETAILTFQRPLTAGRHQLRIGFTARINKFGRGLFHVEYPTDRGRRRMIASHLEPSDARRVFPCWDEPAFKATFALGDGAALVPGGEQHAGGAGGAGHPDLEAGVVPGDAEDVELLVRAGGRRARAHLRANRRRHCQRGHHCRQARAGASRSTRRSLCCAISTITSA